METVTLKKYPRTPHLEGSRLQPGDEDLSQVPFSYIKGKHLVVEEKIDGANTAISFSEDGELLLQSRGHYLTGGNPEWNFSAPHGAGRLMSRKEAFKRLSLDEYRKEMEGIYTSCVDRTTLDEAPMVYKGMDEIISHIGPTVDIVERITPVYNFKAAE